MQTAEKWLSRCFLAAFLIAAASLLLRSRVCAAASVLCIFIVLLKHRPKHFTLWLAAACVLTRLLAVLVLSPPLSSDFLLLHNAAQGILSGDLSLMSREYFLIWAYQTPFVLFEAAVLAVWNDPMAMKLVNVLFSSGTVVLAYRILRAYVRPAAAETASLAACVFPFFVTLPTILTNQIVSLFFLVLAVWLLISPDTERLRIWRFPLAGLSAAVGNLMRPEGLIILVALLVWALFKLLSEPALRKRVLAGMLALLLVYFAVGKGTDLAVRASGINLHGTANEYPAWKFVLGLDYNAGGAYMNSSVTTMWKQLLATFDEEYRPTAATSVLQKQLMRENLPRSAAQWCDFMLGKIDFLWGSSALYWVTQHLDKTSFVTGELVELTEAFDRGLFFTAFTLAALGLAVKKRSADELLPFFVVFAAFFVFLLIEVQPRYAYLPQIFVFMGMGFGLDFLAEKFGGAPENSAGADTPQLPDGDMQTPPKKDVRPGKRRRRA